MRGDVWHGKIALIQMRICKAFDISMIEIKSSRRFKRLIPPRHLAMWLCKKLTSASLPVIARNFGNRDHSTVIAAIKNVDEKFIHVPDFKHLTDQIIEEWYDKNVEPEPNG